MESGNRRAIRTALLIALVVGAGLAIEIVLSNVVFPSRTDDDTVSVLLSYLVVFAALFLVGVSARRAGAGPRGQAYAGVLAGVLLGLLIIGTFVVVDNVWLDVVSRQQTKIDGFAHSHASSMRAYINTGLIGPGIFFTVGLGSLGAVLALAGGLVSRSRPLPG